MANLPRLSSAKRLIFFIPILKYSDAAEEILTGWYHRAQAALWSRRIHLRTAGFSQRGCGGVCCISFAWSWPPFLPHERGRDKRRKPQSRVWGRHSPTSFPRGAKPQNCGFWHRGRNLLCNCLRLPLSGSSVHRTDRTGLAARCGRPFFLSAKDTFQRPPATRWTGIFQNFFCLSNPGTVVLATGGAENFSFHSPHHRVLKFAKRGRQLFSASSTYYGWFSILPNRQQKKQQIFFRLTAFTGRAGGRLVFSFESSVQVGSIT